MRDPKRIQPFISKIAALWHLHPDLRFFQVIGLIEHKLRLMGWNDGFYAEEEAIEAVIDELIASSGSVQPL